MLMNQPLLDDGQDGEPPEILPQVAYKTTTVYDKSLEYFKQGQMILLLFSAGKFVVASTLVVLNTCLGSCQGGTKYYEYDQEIHAWGQDYLQVWMELIIIHGFFAFIYYLALLKYVGNADQNRRVADALGHCIAIEIPEDLVNQADIEEFIDREYEEMNQQQLDRMDIDGPLEESRKVSMMAVDIKKTVQSFSWIGKYIGKGCFVLFQGLELWGLIFYFSNYAVVIQGCDDMYTKFLFVILFLGMYQYLDIYIMFVLVVVFLPLLVCYSIYEWIKDFLRRRSEKRKIDTILNEQSYVDDLTQGSNECSICMQQYVKGEKVVVLPCSDKHHFHSECIRSWFNVNSKCPLCRNHIIDIDHQEP